MAESALFDLVCQEIESATQLSRLAARGAVRLALREAGLEVATLTRKQLGAVLRLVLPAELTKCGVANPDPICAAIDRRVAAAADDPAAAAAPEDMFRRIRGR